METEWTVDGGLTLVGGRTLGSKTEFKIQALRMTSSNPDETLRQMAPAPLEETRVVGGIDYETGEIDISYIPIEDAITKLARLADPDAGNELAVNPPRGDG